ncbi:hypothetical protein ACTFIW_001476 [Dictyostelium discoideum]|uniref:MOB kinase activator-like 2 n=1 Tax=Dictyostelium discoideum TaxID=44689 RepID=MOB2_DICDI|nr:Mob1-like protein [Dictyostelium discoideum AX4]Q54QV0.1 RecName: Full=MOB kinase activator-like 2; AltName: Full=Mob2 homolog; AltName: Full=Mps one binder kinase activator-like 2 [Dictyostelium discoideum]EAL65579.1 Mob1-like protein [Dictyostelium discoideum AX4]|eukprot:XP_638923.1 Mob1-like protein [Dictyostelium discoideum AX4]
MTLFSSLLSRVSKDGKESIRGNYKPKKHPRGSSRHTMRKSLKKNLAGGTVLKESVKCPDGEDENEWIAVNTIEIFNTMNMCYSFIQGFCTEASCPQMTGAKATYLWTDGKGKPQELSAPQYIDNLVNWISEQIDNPEIFPVDDSDFPKNYRPAVIKIISRVLRVYAHIYHAHWDHIQKLDCYQHTNTSLKHLQYFAEHFSLIGEKDLAVMKHVFDTL